MIYILYIPNNKLNSVLRIIIDWIVKFNNLWFFVLKICLNVYVGCVIRY